MSSRLLACISNMRPMRSLRSLVELMTPVPLDRGFDQLLAILLGLIQQVGRNIDVVVFGAERLVIPDHALHAHQIDEAFELVLRADRQLNRNRLRAQTIDNVLQALEEVRADL